MAPDQQQSAAEVMIAAQEAARASEESIRLEALEIKGEDWVGSIDADLFAKLEPLLGRPTPVVYVEHTPAKKNKNDPGLPYDTTGLRSTQFQVDRMNNVLGQQCWRWMMHYTQAGNLARTVIVVGNNLHVCKLDGDTGDLIWYEHVGDETIKADLLVVRDGWGGHTMRSPGDTFKAGETSTLKRVLARFGPGADVFRIDYDGDIIDVMRGEDSTVPFDRTATGSAIKAQVPAPQAAQQVPPPREQLTEQQAEEKLSALLEQETGISNVEGIGDVDLREERNKAIAAMRKVPPNLRPTIVQEFGFLDARKDDARQLRDLVTRAENASV